MVTVADTIARTAVVIYNYDFHVGLNFSRSYISIVSTIGLLSVVIWYKKERSSCGHIDIYFKSLGHIFVVGKSALKPNI